MKLDKFIGSITKEDVTASSRSEKVPFIKAHEIRAEFDGLENKPEEAAKRGDALLRKILTSLAKGRADDQKVVAGVAAEILKRGWYGGQP